MRISLITLLLFAGIASAQDEVSPKLLEIRRIHVDKLTGGDTALQIRDMIIAKLLRAGLFSLTEDPEKADAWLRGSAEDLIYTDTHDTHDSVSARGSVNLGSYSSRSSSGRVALSSSIGENDSSRITERKHEAMAALRLVDQEGDVIWSTVQESQGAKFHGASADVAEKVTRQLVADYRRARQQSAVTEPAAADRTEDGPESNR